MSFVQCLFGDNQMARDYISNGIVSHHMGYGAYALRSAGKVGNL